MAEILTAIGSLLWPLVVAAALLFFWRPLRRVISSAEQRQFTVRFGDREMTFGEVTDQQQRLVEDLQAQVNELHARLGKDSLGKDSTEPDAVPGQSATAASARGVLWVDDNPENNALLADQLERNRIVVETALSTEEALEKLGRGRGYQAIVTDMGRHEDGRSVSDAGMRLLREVRAVDPTVPVIVYSSSGAVRRYYDEAVTAGANTVTSSPTEVTGAFRRLGLL